MKKRIVLLGICVLIASLWGCKGDNGVTNPPGGGGTQIRITSINPSTLSRGAQGVLFTISGAGFPADVLVDLGPGVSIVTKTVLNAQTIELTVNVLPAASAGSRTVVVTSGINSAQLQSGLTISDNKAPLADFFTNPTQGTPATLFDIDASGSVDSDGRIATFRWEISDGTSPSGMKLKKQFSQKGKYTIRLTVTDDKGGVSSLEKTVEVAENKPPQANFTMTPPNGSQLTDFVFDASTSIDPDGEIRSYQWDLGGFTINGKRVTHKFNKEGDYTILLMVKDSSGSSSFSRKTLPVVFFDRDKAKQDINDVIVDFLKLFDDLETRSAEDIVRGFSKAPGCTGRSKEISVIEVNKATVRYASVEFLGPANVTSVDDHRGNANITNRFSGEFKDGVQYDGKATHYFFLNNEADGWKICNFYVVKD